MKLCNLWRTPKVVGLTLHFDCTDDKGQAVSVELRFTSAWRMLRWVTPLYKKALVLRKHEKVSDDSGYRMDS